MFKKSAKYFFLFVLVLRCLDSFSSNIDSLLNNSYKLQYSNPTSAKLYVDSALNLIEINKDYKSYSNVYNQLGHLYFIDGNLDMSLHFYEKAKTYAEEFEQNLQIIESLIGIGSNYDFLEDYKLALKYFFQALELSEQTDDLSKLANIYNNIGRVYYVLGKLDLAISYLEKCVELDRQNNDLEGLAYSYSNLGAFLYEKGDLNKALEYQESAIKIRKTSNNKLLLARSYNNLANVLSALGEYNKAIENYLIALEIKRTSNNLIEITSTLNNIGNTYLEMNGKENKAKIYLKEAENLLDSVSISTNKLDNLKYLSDLYYSIDSTKKAYLYLSEYYQLRDEFRLKKEKKFNEEVLDINFKDKVKDKTSYLVIIYSIVITSAFIVLIFIKFKK